MALAIPKRFGRAVPDVQTGECDSILLSHSAWRYRTKRNGGDRNTTHAQQITHARTPRSVDAEALLAFRQIAGNCAQHTNPRHMCRRRFYAFVRGRTIFPGAVVPPRAEHLKPAEHIFPASAR